ncbi:MAG: redoxin family protein [Candidatus Eremiobacteraeota bacterium]|nr:redoxin family protein [Candidatus Eremiobacteraeota bacterium]
MNKLVAGALIALAATAGVGARVATAHLEHGAVAPPFALQAAEGGNVATIELKSALAKGPVVLYFFPKSFTTGCTVEAHLFSEHIADYKKLGAQVIGVSGDDIATQKRFSTEECRSAFLVASDPGLKVAKEYDAALAPGYANRTSYVIASDGTVAYSYTSLDPSKHVANTLDALRALAAKK